MSTNLKELLSRGQELLSNSGYNEIDKYVVSELISGLKGKKLEAVSYIQGLELLEKKHSENHRNYQDVIDAKYKENKEAGKIYKKLKNIARKKRRKAVGKHAVGTKVYVDMVLVDFMNKRKRSFEKNKSKERRGDAADSAQPPKKKQKSQKKKKRRKKKKSEKKEKKDAPPREGAKYTSDMEIIQDILRKESSAVSMFDEDSVFEDEEEPEAGESRSLDFFKEGSLTPILKEKMKRNEIGVEDIGMDVSEIISKASELYIRDIVDELMNVKRFSIDDQQQMKARRRKKRGGRRTRRMIDEDEDDDEEEEEEEEEELEGEGDDDEEEEEKDEDEDDDDDEEDGVIRMKHLKSVLQYCNSFSKSKIVHNIENKTY